MPDQDSRRQLRDLRSIRAYGYPPIAIRVPPAPKRLQTRRHVAHRARLRPAWQTNSVN